MTNETNTPKADLDFAERHDKARVEASHRAVQSVLGMNLQKQILLPSSLNHLGPSVDSLYRHELGEALKQHSDSLSSLISLAVHDVWFAAWNAAHYMAILHDGEDDKRLIHPETTWTAENYASLDGWANTLYNELASIQADAGRLRFLEGTPFNVPLTQGEALDAISLYWMHLADDSARQLNCREASEWLHEAYDARVLSNGIYMWDEGFKFGKEEEAAAATVNARSSLARSAAAARHSENRSMKQSVFSWCDSNMASARSMDAAASQVAGVVVPVAWRTVREWMTEWKKLRSAGTP